MLVGNAIRLTSGPARFNVSNTAIYTQDVPGYGSRKNFFIGWHASEQTRIHGSQPSGVGHPYCWLWAIKPGGLASRNICEGNSTVTGEIKIIAGLSGDASGDCTITGDLGLFISVSGNAVGNCTITCNATGVISVSGDANVEGDTGFPTVDQISSSVWEKIIEAGYTAEEVLKLIGAVHLGTSAGFPTSPVFKGLDGTTTRVNGSVDGSGNRTSVTLNP